MNLSELYIGCRTYRRFKQDPIPQELVCSILENCRIASSARNGQTLRFAAVTSPEKVAAMQSMVRFAGALPPEIGMPKPGEQPVAFLVIIKTQPDNRWSDMDVGIAANTICTTAWESGFGSCMLGAINKAKISELIGTGEGEEVCLAVALGKPAHKSTLVEVPESGSLSYYVDDNVDYYVPKKDFDEVCSIL